MPCTSHYNEVHITDKGEFLKVSPPPTNGEEYFTYTGVSLVDLNGFPYVADKSSFFETVVNTKIGKVKTFTPLDPFEYWDFGTLELYLSNIEKILSTKSGLFWDFLIENELVYNSAIDGDSYKSLSGLFKKDHGKSASSLSISIREEGAEFNLL